PREAIGLAEGFRQHFRAEAGAAHSEHNGIDKGLALHPLRKGLIAIDRLLLARDSIEPAEPLVLVGPRPQRRIALPQRTHLAAGAPFLFGPFDVLLDRRTKLQLLAIDLRTEQL